MGQGILLGMGLKDTIPEGAGSSASNGSPNKDGPWKSEEWLREQYITKDRSQQSIANECDVKKGTIRYWRNKYDIHKGRKCPECDHQSEGLGNHFAQAGHGYPDMDREKREILVGHIMGDAWYDRRDGGYGALGWEMKNLPFMKWLKRQLGWVCSEPRVKRTAEEHALNSFLRDSNYGGSDKSGYNTTYSSYTVGHPWFDRLDWIEDGGKRYPDTLTLTPLMVKVWYCDDGNLWWGDRGRPNARITCSGQSESLPLLADKFEEEVCRPSVYGDDTLSFSAENTETLMDWMGDAPDGMEYKFCLESKEQYKMLKREP